MHAEHLCIVLHYGECKPVLNVTFLMQACCPVCCQLGHKIHTVFVAAAVLLAWCKQQHAYREFCQLLLIKDICQDYDSTVTIIYF